MEHAHHAHHANHANHAHAESVNRTAVVATLHCLLGCAIGEVAFPVNRWLIARGKGHALAHGHH